MTEPTTIRELMEEIAALSTFDASCPDACNCIGCQIGERAVAALALLDNAKRHWNDAAQDTRYRYVYDPDPAPHPKETDAAL